MIGIAGCASNDEANSTADYPALYLQQVEQQQKLQPAGNSNPGAHSAQLSEQYSQPQLRQKFSDFIQLFSSLDAQNIDSRVSNVYARNLYFNDTLKIIKSRTELASYLKKLSENVEYSRVQINRIIPDGDDYFLQWTMETGFSVFGKSVRTRSIGMTHVRLDTQGKVNFHQDFWDSTEGLFRHLPVIGYLIDKARDRI